MAATAASCRATIPGRKCGRTRSVGAERRRRPQRHRPVRLRPKTAPRLRRAAAAESFGGRVPVRRVPQRHRPVVRSRCNGGPNHLRRHRRRQRRRTSGVPSAFVARTVRQPPGTTTRRRVRVMGRRTAVRAHDRHRRNGSLHSSELNDSALRIREPSRFAMDVSMAAAPTGLRPQGAARMSARVAMAAWFRLRFGNGLAGLHKNAHRRGRQSSDPGIWLPDVGTSQPTNLLKSWGDLSKQMGTICLDRTIRRAWPGRLEAV
jgi:hypothetical protein